MHKKIFLTFECVKAKFLLKIRDEMIKVESTWWTKIVFEIFFLGNTDEGSKIASACQCRDESRSPSVFTNQSLWRNYHNKTDGGQCFQLNIFR